MPLSEVQRLLSPLVVKDESNDRRKLTQEESDLVTREFGPLGELKRKEIALNKDWDIYCDREKAELEVEEEIIKREQLNHDLKVVERKAEVFKRKKSLKELGMIRKKKRIFDGFCGKRNWRTEKKQ